MSTNELIQGLYSKIKDLEAEKKDLLETIDHYERVIDTFDEKIFKMTIALEDHKKTFDRIFHAHWDLRQ